MSQRPDSAVTLLEIMISLSIITFISLALFGINYFGQFQINTAGRWIKVQNGVSYVFEHIARNAAKAVNNADNPAIDTATTGTIQIWTDYDGDGQLDITRDRHVAYTYSGNIIRYYSDLIGSPSSYESLTGAIILPSFISDPSMAGDTCYYYNSGNNYFDLKITGCYDPDGSPKDCGDTENPKVLMRSRIQMPGVSTN